MMSNKFQIDRFTSLNFFITLVPCNNKKMGFTMNKLYLFIIILLFTKEGRAQNLVLNSDMEQYSQCPNNYNQLANLISWSNPCYNPDSNFMGTPDYFNQCALSIVSVPSNGRGNEPAHSGAGYCGVFLTVVGVPNFREYVEATLSTPLTANACYHFEMYVSLGDVCKFTTDAFGAYFSDTLVANYPIYTPLPFTPQVINPPGSYLDTLGWTLISADYTAHGGESYILIGNFANDNFTSTQVINSNTFGMHVYFYVDDVSLSLCTDVNNLNNEVNIRVYPNPFTDELRVKSSSMEESEIILSDVASRKLIRQNFTGSFSLNASQLSSGIYIYEVRNKNGIIKSGKLVKN